MSIGIVDEMFQSQTEEGRVTYLVPNSYNRSQVGWGGGGMPLLSIFFFFGNFFAAFSLKG